MEDLSLIRQLQDELPAVEADAVSWEELMARWAQYFNDLIQHDFAKLLALLYRIDISEKKLRILLKENPGEDAGKIIADLVRERLLQKIRTREENRSSPGAFHDDPDLEAW